jgi:hypothetical protein
MGANKNSPRDLGLYPKSQPKPLSSSSDKTAYLAEPCDDRTETRHDWTETRLSQMTIGQNSVVRRSRCRNHEADENYSNQQAEGTRTASGGQSATEKVSATKRRSKRLDTQAKEEIHASEKIGAARASEVDRLMAIARGLGPWSLAAKEFRSKSREGKLEIWARDGVARQTKSEAKKLWATEPLGGTSTGTAGKTEENHRP